MEFRSVIRFENYYKHPLLSQMYVIIVGPRLRSSVRRFHGKYRLKHAVLRFLYSTCDFWDKHDLVARETRARRRG